MNPPNPQNPSHTHRVHMPEKFGTDMQVNGTCADPNCREEEAMELVSLMKTVIERQKVHGWYAGSVDDEILWKEGNPLLLRAESLLASRRKEAGG